MNQFTEKTILNHIKINDLSIEGRGVGKTNEGIIIFCKQTIPGDIVNAKINKIKKNYIECEVEEFIEYSPLRIEPVCKHFSVCSGCTLQHLKYTEQINFKKKYLNDVFQRLGRIEHNIDYKIKESKKQFFYRNKIELSLNFQNNEVVLGYHFKNQPFEILDIEECFLFDENIKDFITSLKKSIKKLEIPVYNLKEKKGILRNILLKKNSKNEWMITYGITRINQNIKNKLELLSKEMISNFPEIKSGFISIFKQNDDFYSAKNFKIAGKDFLTEALNNYIFFIKPNIFFQINFEQLNYMIDYLISLISSIKVETVFDLYCGTGIWGILASKLVKQIIGIDIIPSSIETGKQIAKINHIDNIKFYSGNVEDILKKINKKIKPDLIIVDPPRKGLSSIIIDKIMQIKSPYLIYISCNPSTQARDIEKLKKIYKIQKQQAFDMFPQTTQFENLLFLVKK